MSRLLALTLVCLTASSAAADGAYFFESVGANRVTNHADHVLDVPMRIRVGVGYRLKDWALEAYVGGYAGNFHHGAPPAPACDPERCIAARRTEPEPPLHDHGGEQLITYGMEYKRISRVSKHLEVYAGGGLGRGFVPGELAGTGLTLRVGAQLEGKIPAAGFLFWPLFFTNWGPKVNAAVFVDGGSDFYVLRGHGDRRVDAHMTHLTAGFAIGADF